MQGQDALDATVFDVVKDVPINVGIRIADAIGRRLSEFETTTIRELDADQLTKVCELAHVSADVVLGLA